MIEVDLNYVEWLANQNRHDLACILYDHQDRSFTDLMKKKRGALVSCILQLEIKSGRYQQEIGRFTLGN
jgi:hypothetical protein